MTIATSASHQLNRPNQLPEMATEKGNNDSRGSKNTFVTEMESAFQHVVNLIHQNLQADEHFTIELVAEQSQFTRFNRGKTRQTGVVTDGTLDFTLMAHHRRSFRIFSLSGDRSLDTQKVLDALASLRVELPQLPIDPYLVLPSGTANSREIYTGSVAFPDELISDILSPVSDLDFTGIYAGGSAIRAYADSDGQYHWFATDSITLDYSLFTTDGQAVKGMMAGKMWDSVAYQNKLKESRVQLDRMMVSPKAIAPGQYRTYLAPAAVAELLSMLSWDGVSESALQKGNSALGRLQRGDAALSSQFVLKENFSRGLVPRFNDLGEVAPPSLTIIENGQLVNSLISSRTAKEYGKVSNGAAGWEGLRSPDVSPGTLASEEILKVLDTGLYISNLHYLNWSDRPSGRITGMTRYACFWVENGTIVAPIQNLRFDDSLYHFFGNQLVTLTRTQEFIPEVGSYNQRELGGTWVPGMLVNAFTYTL